MNDLIHLKPAAAAAESNPDTTDEQLMEIIQARFRHGLDLLHGRYAKRLKEMSFKVLQSDADAEDLIQEVFVEIWKRAASYDPLKGRPFSWIATLTRRRSIDRLRKREAWSRVEFRFAEETQGLSDGWNHVHEEVSHAEVSNHLKRALATLPEVQQNAIEMAYHKQMTQREIAALTGIPLGTIKTRLTLGLRKMALFLQGFEDLLWPELCFASPKSSERLSPL